MNIQLIILKTLQPTGGLMLALETLKNEIRVGGTQVTGTDLKLQLEALESKGQVVGVTNADAPGGSRWKITDSGKARLAEAIL